MATESIQVSVTLEPLHRSTSKRRSRVFAYFVEPDKLTLWLGQWAELERPAGRLALDIQGTVIRGRSLEIIPIIG
jgi:uncharacterized protein YndB with AHSA1/START domain